jgi:ABC-type uncharacterized transport system permease subunit
MIAIVGLVLYCIVVPLVRRIGGGASEVEVEVEVVVVVVVVAERDGKM